VLNPEAKDFCVLVGSIRANSFSLKIADLIVQLAERGGKSCIVIDPRDLKLGIPHHPDDRGQASAHASYLQAVIKKSKSVVFVSPEYDGSYSAVTKILIEHLGYPSALSGKFISIIGVAAGRIGADRAIDHLRGVLIHIGAFVLPNCLSIAEVHKFFSENGTVDQGFLERVENLMADLLKFQTRT